MVFESGRRAHRPASYNLRVINKQLLLAIGLNLAVCSAQSQTDRLHNDWAYLAKYREANAVLAPPAPADARVVFMGDSITENWARMDEKFFETNTYIGRGISGQTTPQMLVRFRADVIDLKPKLGALFWPAPTTSPEKRARPAWK